MTSTLAFALLVGALLLFLLSTRQWKLLLRGVVWGAGLLMLIGAWVIVAGDHQRGGVFQAFGDLAAHWYAPSESVLFQSLSHNGQHIARFVVPLLDLFLIFGAVLAVLAIVAFTPGEALERMIRPIMIGLVGAIFGGVIALAVVGTGFGPVAQQRVYSTYVDANGVTDGDTFFVGEVSVRLAGIDAPEYSATASDRSQICRSGPRLQTVSQCGADAVRHLKDLIGGTLVTCVVDEDQSGKPLRSDDAFGRPLVHCEAKRGEQRFDVGRQMVADGFAIEYQNLVGDYGGAARVAYQENLNVVGMCSLRPDIWRDDPRAAIAFRDRGTLPRESMRLMGRCPRVSTPAPTPGPVAPP